MGHGGMVAKAATIRSVQTRTRPIFMSALTSIFGMLPLVIMTGPGSELYRGLGSVVLGGLLVSTLFSLLVVPVMFTLFLDFRSWLSGAQPAAGNDDALPVRVATEPALGAEPALGGEPAVTVPRVPAAASD